MKRRETTCPYATCADSSYWRRAVAQVPPADVDPVISTKFVISKSDKVATAGSCFAQHISRYLARHDFNYFVAEPGSSILDEELKRQYNYGTFSCRYGNVYTVRQLMQLIRRATGSFIPMEKPWREAGKIFDPLRPQIQPEGFTSMAEYEADLAFHLRAVARMLDEMDVFIFTLGLTEAWQAVSDGTVFPVCPGCGAGTFDPEQYRFVNFSVTEVEQDLRAVVELLQQKNPKLRIIFTVSPVPLVATYENQHVLQATTYSKSVLRVAAEMVAQDHALVDYFPSYEIITGSHTRGAYFGPDFREVTDEGVARVMQLFAKHYLGMSGTAVDSSGPGPASTPSMERGISSNKLAAAVVCDEEILDN